MSISWVCSFTESYFSEIDKIVQFENTTPTDQNKSTYTRLTRLIGVVFSNGAMLSVSHKFDSVNKCTQEISEFMKLHIQGVRQNADKFIRQRAHVISVM